MEPSDIGPWEPVERVATRGVLTVDERMSLRSLADVLGRAGIGVAIVRRPNGSAGVVSERDIIRALGLGADPDEVWVADVMSDDLVAADVGEPIVRAASRMIAANVRHVVIADRGAIVGIASMRDLLEVLVGETLTLD